MKTYTAKLCVQMRAKVGEGTIWDIHKQVLYWLDIGGHKLFIYNPADGTNKEYQFDQHVTAVVPRQTGGFVLAMRDGFATFDPETNTLNMIADPEADNPENRFNDGKCDPAGRFFAGTMPFSCDRFTGSLYRLDINKSVHHLRDGVGISNGIVWTSDNKTMYHIDSLAKTVTAYDYDLVTGDINNGRVIITVPEALGLPDGMSIDTEDMLWIAHYNGHAVRRWNPHTGKILAEVKVDAAQVTSCAFGGADLKTLYITTATEHLTEADFAREPLSGSLFVVDVDEQGVPANWFQG